MKAYAKITLLSLFALCAHAAQAKPVASQKITLSAAEISMLGYDPHITYIQETNTNIHKGNPVLHVHGFGGSHKCSSILKRNNELPGNIITFNFPEIADNKAVQIAHTSLGQWNDVRILLFVLHKCKTTLKINTIDIHAHSRGGAATCNLFGALKTNSYDELITNMGIDKNNLPRIGSIAFASPLTSVEAVIEQKIYRLCGRAADFLSLPIQGAASVVNCCVAPLIFRKYRPWGMNPLKNAALIDVPVILTTPPHDPLVPSNSSHQLYHALKKNGRCSDLQFITEGYRNNDGHMIIFQRHLPELHTFRSKHGGSYNVEIKQRKKTSNPPIIQPEHRLKNVPLLRAGNVALWSAAVAAGAYLLKKKNHTVA